MYREHRKKFIQPSPMVIFDVNVFNNAGKNDRYDRRGNLVSHCTLEAAIFIQAK